MSTYEFKLKFDWDPAKSASNEAKHGLSLAAVTALWAGPVLTLPFAAVSRSENCGQTPGGQQAATVQQPTTRRHPPPHLRPPLPRS